MASGIKTIRNVVVVLIALLVAAVAAVYTLSSMRMNKKYPLVEASPRAPKDLASIAEGHRLYISRGCIECHGPDLSGKTFIDDPAMGKYTGANLTSGKGGAASVMSDSDFTRAIRHGIAPDGRALIFMPATDFQGMSDEDVGKIIAYIRSVPPVNKPSTPESVGPLARVLFLAGKMPLLVTAELIDHNAKPPVQVTAAATVEYGKYLANGCTGCHGQHFSGGPIPGGAPDWPPAANITPTGIGSWSEADFIKVLRTGVRPDGSALKPPMPWQNLSMMTDVELKALWMYLHTVPARVAGNH
jgi:mono/diheme cytochrome c family protein